MRGVRSEMIRLGSHECLSDLTNHVGLLDKGSGLASKGSERHQEHEGKEIAHGFSFLANVERMHADD